MRSSKIYGWFVFLMLTACAAPVVIEGQLTPYGATATESVLVVTPTQSATVLPTPSPTPQYHTVAAGDTMSSIAYRYGVDLNELITSNPDINPNLMIAGMQVLVPPRSPGTSVDGLVNTPEAVGLSAPVCYTEKSGGMWCFMDALNENDTAVENVVVEITVGDLDATQLTAQFATTPLNLIPSGGSMSLSAYFPGPVPEPFRYSYQLISAIPAETEGRYLETRILQQDVDIMGDGLTAQVSARVFTNGIAGSTVQIWLGLTARDAEGQIVGVRRIEQVAELGEDGIVELSGYIYSSGEAIEVVEIVAEAVNVP